MVLPHIILSDSGSDLLRLELHEAFTSLGCKVSRVHPTALSTPENPDYLPNLLEKTGPALVLSINFQGLSPLKQVIEEASKKGSSVAAWCVDNPWNVLSGVRDPRWKDITLYVTDDSFIPQLERHGARKVHHLPLAGWPGGFLPSELRESGFPPPEDLAPMVFVGRSAFPGRERFFAGQSVPESMIEEAKALMEKGARPDLLWWISRLGADSKEYWPGKALRPASLGAEEASLLWRARCLHESARAGELVAHTTPPGVTQHTLDVFGDAGWHDHLPPKARALPSVDYYARLPGIYKKARYTLALTSMQLPHGLNQRHFDVWLAGGFCLTDKTPGLTLFPESLTRHIAFQTPAEISSLVKRLEASPSLRADIQGAWLDHIKTHHTYTHRAEFILKHTGRF